VGANGNEAQQQGEKKDNNDNNNNNNNNNNNKQQQQQQQQQQQRDQQRDAGTATAASEAASEPPEGPVLEELLLVPVSQLRLLTYGKKVSAMAVIARVTGATIRKEPKPPTVGEGEENEGEGEGEGERLVKVHVLSPVEAKMRAAVEALNAVLEGKVCWGWGVSSFVGVWSD
jgi:hypothetical protein